MEEGKEKEKSEKRAKSAKKPNKSGLNIEAADEKTNLKAENFKNAKIMPLIEEAWDLL